MATNAESAKHWLENNKHKVSEARVTQIRDNLLRKIEAITETEENDNPDVHQGLLDALDVMDAFIHNQYGDPQSVQNSVAPDYSPLASNTPDEVPALDKPEKQKRFRELLKNSKF